MSNPTAKLEVSFTTTPLSTAPSWTDISGDVRDVSFIRGRERDLDEFRPGTLTAVLDNRLRVYDPMHSTNVKPMKRVRFSAIYGGSTYRLFDGFADSWDQGYEKPKQATCELTATDGFKIMAGTDLPESVYEAEVAADSPVFWAKLEEPSGSTTVGDSVGGRVAPVTGSPTLGVEGLRSLPPGAAVTFPGSAASFDFPAGTKSHNIEALVQRNSGASDALIASQGSPVYGFATPMWQLRLTASNFLQFKAFHDQLTVTTTSALSTGSVYHVVATRTARSPASNPADAIGRIYVNGSLVKSSTASIFDVDDPSGSAGLRIGPSSTEAVSYTVDEVATYLTSTAMSPTRIAAHNTAARTPWNNELTSARLARILDLISWPSALRNLDTGNQNCQSTPLGTTVLAYVQKIGATEAGYLFMSKDGKVRFISRTNSFSAASAATFGDSGSELKYADLSFDYSDQSLVNEATVSRDRGTAITAEDATSQAAFLRHTLTKEGLLHDTDSASAYHAQFLVYQRKDPKLRITAMTILPQRSPTTLFPVVLARELGDVVTVRRRPQGVGATIEETLVVEGIEMRVSDASKVWQVEWKLSNADDRGFWRLGTAGYSELGTTTVLGF